MRRSEMLVADAGEQGRDAVCSLAAADGGDGWQVESNRESCGRPERRRRFVDILNQMAKQNASISAWSSI